MPFLDGGRGEHIYLCRKLARKDFPRGQREFWERPTLVYFPITLLLRETCQERLIISIYISNDILGRGGFLKSLINHLDLSSDLLAASSFFS